MVGAYKHPNRKFVDPTLPDPKNRKQICFHEDRDRYVSFVTKLEFDEMSISAFFRAIVMSYIEGNQHIYDFIEEYKEKYSVQSVDKQKLSKKLRREEAEKKKMFSLQEGEIETIFDIIEKEGKLDLS